VLAAVAVGVAAAAMAPEGGPVFMPVTGPFPGTKRPPGAYPAWTVRPPDLRSEPAREALARHEEWLERKDRAADKTFLMGGRTDHYQVLRLDPGSGELVTAARHDGPEVHGIQVLPMHDLALVFEDNRKTLLILSLETP
jgi:hypothetical protein